MTEPDPRQPSRREPSYPDDEISLYDLWWTLARRKWVLVGIAAVVIAVGVIHALLREPEYTYTTTIELGRIAEPASDGHFRMTTVESPSSVGSLITDSLIPMVRDELRSAEDGHGPHGVSANVPEDETRFVHLRSEAPADAAGDVEVVHQRIIDELASEQEEAFEAARTRLRDELESARDELEADLADIRREAEQRERERAAIEARLARLEGRAERLDRRIADTEARLARARDLMERASGESADEADAMALLLLQSNIGRMHDRLYDLEEQRFTRLPDREDELRLELGSVETGQETLQARGERRQARFERQSADIESALEDMQPTRARILASRSSAPTGASASLIIALSVVLGAMLGVFGAFFAEFLANARRMADSTDD